MSSSVGAVTPARPPPRREAGRERVAGADRVDDRRRARRARSPRPSAVTIVVAEPPVVTSTTRAPAASSSPAAAVSATPGRRNARSSSLALTTSARASTRHSRATYAVAVVDDRRAAVDVDEHEHVPGRTQDDRLDRRRHRLQHESEPAGHEHAASRSAGGGPASPTGHSCRRCRSGTSPRRAPSSSATASVVGRAVRCSSPRSTPDDASPSASCRPKPSVGDRRQQRRRRAEPGAAARHVVRRAAGRGLDRPAGRDDEIDERLPGDHDHGRDVGTSGRVERPGQEHHGRVRVCR